MIGDVNEVYFLLILFAIITLGKKILYYDLENLVSLENEILDDKDFDW